MTALTTEEQELVARVEVAWSGAPPHLGHDTRSLLAIIKRLDAANERLMVDGNACVSGWMDELNAKKLVIELLRMERNQARKEAERWRAAYFDVHKNNGMLWQIGCESQAEFERKELLSWETPAAKEGE